jgi:PPOX class probable F420-dependent enzyme
VIDGDVFTGPQAAFIGVQRVAHLATVLPDGTPHVIPVSTVLDLNRIVFASDRGVRKVRNLRMNPNVCICFDEYSEDWSQLKQVIVFGEAYVVESGPEFERDRRLLYGTYTQYEAEAPIDAESSVIVEVRADRVVSSGF